MVLCPRTPVAAVEPAELVQDNMLWGNLHGIAISGPFHGEVVRNSLQVGPK